MRSIEPGISRFRVRSCGPPRNDNSSHLRYDFRSGRLMHRRMRGVRDPRLLVDHRKPPDAFLRAGVMIEPRHRTIVDVKGEALVGLAAEREADGGPDRPAMGDRDHI